MKWFAGGSWSVCEVDTPSALTFRAVLWEPPATGQARILRRSAASNFLNHPEKWLTYVGNPSQLAVYDLGDSAFDDAVADLYRIWVDFRESDLPLEERDDRTALLKSALDFTTLWGPLGRLPGVLEVLRSYERGVAPADSFGPSFDLDEWWMTVKGLVLNWEAIRNGVGKAERDSCFHWMEEGSREELRETQVRPVMIDGVVAFRALPLTFRAFLWTTLFERLASASWGLCRACGAAFPVTHRGGRPFAYCDKHRGSKFREAARQKKARSTYGDSE